MRLSDVKTGTPVRVQAYENGERVADIWGKIRKSNNRESQIDIYYYEGKSINLTEATYELKAMAYADGEHELEMKNPKIKEIENLDCSLMEQRETFRIYISKVVEVIVDDIETAALLVDLSEGGFRLAMRGNFTKDSEVKIHIEDDDFDFFIKGNVVWVKHFDDLKSICGCKMAEGEDTEKVLDYIKEKQKALFEEIQQEIDKNK